MEHIWLTIGSIVAILIVFIAATKTLVDRLARSIESYVESTGQVTHKISDAVTKVVTTTDLTAGVVIKTLGIVEENSKTIGRILIIIEENKKE